MTESLVRYGVDARGIATVTIDDPATRNALGDALLDQLIDHLEAARDDDDVRVVVLASSGSKVFSSGGNLKAFADDSPIIEKYAGLDRFPRLYALIGGLGKPIICAAGGATTYTNHAESGVRGAVTYKLRLCSIAATTYQATLKMDRMCQSMIKANDRAPGPAMGSASPRVSKIAWGLIVPAVSSSPSNTRAMY